MWHLGENRLDAAWQDVFAIHRLSHLVPRVHARGTARRPSGQRNRLRCTVTLLDHRELTPEHARQVLRDLAGLPPFANVARSLEQMETP